MVFITSELEAFNGINELKMSGTRCLYKGNRLIVRADVEANGDIHLFRSGVGMVVCKEVSDFQQKLGEFLAEYIR